MLTLDKRINSKKKQGSASLFFWYKRYCKLAWITISECFLVKKIATKGNRTLNPIFRIGWLIPQRFRNWLKPKNNRSIKKRRKNTSPFWKKIIYAKILGKNRSMCCFHNRISYMGVVLCCGNMRVPHHFLNNSEMNIVF